MPTRCSERGGDWIALLAAAALAGAINGYMFLLAAVIVRILTVTESRRPCEVAPLEVFGGIAAPPVHRARRAGCAPAAVHRPGRALAAAQFHGPRAPALPDGHQRQGLGAEARARLDPPVG